MLKTMIRTFFLKPYNLLLLTATILFILSFFYYGQSVDFHLHDTYFVVSEIYFIWILSLLFLLGWTLYKVTNKFLPNKYLTGFHVLTTIAILVIFMTANYWHDTLLPPIKREFVSWQTLEADQQREMKIYLPIAIIFVTGQIAFIINLLAGLIKQRH